MKKNTLLAVMILLSLSCRSYAGEGLSVWEKLGVGTIADDDMLPITDVSDTTQSLAGSSKTVTASQVKTYVLNGLLDDSPADNDTATAPTSNALVDGLAGKANTLGSDDNYVTDAEKTKLANLSGTNTGDQSLAGLVATTGNETIAGVKTFSSSPVVPTPTTDMQAATKKYVDDNAGSGTPEVQDEAFSAANFDADTTHAVSQDDFYDRMHLFDADDDGSFTDEAWFPSTTGAPTSASYLTATAEAGLSAEANLGALTTGLLKVTVAAGSATPSTAVAGTDYQAPLTNPVVQANLGTGMYTFLGTPSGANLAATLTTSLPPTKGGTGVANGSNNTITFTGNYTFGATLAGNTSVTFPTSGTLMTTSGNTTGSAATLTTARNIGGVSFNGSADINLPGVNTTGNQNTSGTAAGLSGTPNITVGTVSAGAGGFAVDADGDTTVKSLNQAKASGVAGDIGLYEANSTDTHAAGWRGPLSLAAAYRGQFANAGPTEAAIQVWGAAGSGDGAAATPYIHAVPFVNLGELFTVSGSSLVVRTGTSLPGTCVAGALFLDTDADTNGQLYSCVATNTWKDVDDDGGAAGTPAAITVADTTDTTSYVALFESATGDLGPKTDAGLTYNAGTGMLTATGFTGPLTGTASGNLVSGGAIGVATEVSLS